jgi:sterol desaturase/sphingolipid hydroxylase (fatty acid hydroxylase superfamily)
MIALKIAATVAGACLFTEFVGYFIHILLHSNKIGFLSRNHMIHHLKVYQPKRGMRSAQYLGSTYGRAEVDGVGLEWLAPIAVILAGFFGVCWALEVAWYYQALFIAVALLWGRWVFGVMHDAMHLEDFWMAKNPLTRAWFVNVRRLHDIHHLSIEDDGRMIKNYGICFFGMDRLFGSLKTKMTSFNEKGYRAALERYAAIIN